MKALYFRNPVFNDGANLSVRRGIKWALEDGKEVFLADMGGTSFAIVTIAARVVPFNVLSDFDLSAEHDPACRDYGGLLAEMQAVYLNFDQHEIVTLVTFDYTLTPSGDSVAI